MTSGDGPQFFPNASNAMIINPTITHVNGDFYSKSLENFGLRLLLENVAEGAFHDAAERGDPPRCHPNTRKAIRAEIMEWITAPQAARKLILWMYGPAGAGKTAIAQSVAEECDRLGLLAASFFFWRTAAGRNDTSRFVATIAYQLSRYIPQMKDHLLTAIEKDPTIFSRSLSKQMRVLVIKPLKLAAPSLSTPIFAIVDGVDECGPDGRSQSEVLHLLGSVASELQHLPLIFLVASRPEYEIREAFNGNLLNPLTRVMVLDNSYKPDRDIKRYFDSTFRDIYKKHRRLGRRLPSVWPAPSDVDFLVSKASGQFIFAATVTKFIDSPRRNPADQMNTILRLSTGGNETPFMVLDALYRFVLDSVADVERVLDILAFILQHDHNQDEIDGLDQAEELLGIEFRSVLIDMHSLVRVPPLSDTNAELPSIYHASFGDFLMDRSRSRQYCIGTSEGRLRISRRCLRTIGSLQHLQFLTKRHVVGCFVNYTEQLPPSEDLVDDLAHLDLRASLEGISDINRDIYNAYWKGFFVCVKQQVGPHRLDVFLRLQNDFDAFILHRLRQYPRSLRTYIPILLCCLHLSTPFDMFRILLHGASNSAEYQKFLDLDGGLLQMYEAASVYEEDDVHVSALFQDKARAGKYFVDSGRYAALAKAIVSVVSAKYATIDAQMRIYEIELWFFQDILKEASMDWDLAHFLREHAVQFRNDVEPILGRRTIAEASIKYIQRCGIPFLEHSHRPDRNECAICKSPPNKLITPIPRSSSSAAAIYEPFPLLIPPISPNLSGHPQTQETSPLPHSASPRARLSGHRYRQ